MFLFVHSFIFLLHYTSHTHTHATFAHWKLLILPFFLHLGSHLHLHWQPYTSGVSFTPEQMMQSPLLSLKTSLPLCLLTLFWPRRREAWTGPPALHACGAWCVQRGALAAAPTPQPSFSLSSGGWQCVLWQQQHPRLGRSVRWSIWPRLSACPYNHSLTWVHLWTPLCRSDGVPVAFLPFPEQARKEEADIHLPPPPPTTHPTPHTRFCFCCQPCLSSPWNLFGCPHGDFSSLTSEANSNVCVYVLYTP